MKKRTLTLIEVMIVILLITLIGGAIGYNMKGSLNKGRQFKTKQGKERLHDYLLICLEEGTSGKKLEENPDHYLKKLGLAVDPDKVMYDGWGMKYTVKYLEDKQDFEVTSPND